MVGTDSCKTSKRSYTLLELVVDALRANRIEVLSEKEPPASTRRTTFVVTNIPDESELDAFLEYVNIQITATVTALNRTTVYNLEFSELELKLVDGAVVQGGVFNWRV